MERLTKRNCHDFAIPTRGTDAVSMLQAIDRLATIEDILGDEYDLELVQKLIQAYKEGRYIIMKEPEQAGVSRLRELAQADREGRCVVLPESYYTAEAAARKASGPAEQSERGQAAAWIMQRFGQMS